MKTYYIVCTEQEPVTSPKRYQHIVKVGLDTSGDGRADKSHTLEGVIENLTKTDPDLYYSRHGGSVADARVEVIDCKCGCKKKHIRSLPDKSTVNNLDNLRTCNW